MARRAPSGEVRIVRILLDTNVILDVLLDRTPWVHDASAIWQRCDDGHAIGHMAASVLTDIYYIARRLTDRTKAVQALRLCLQTFTIGPIDRLVAETALRYSGLDFEDNILMACISLYQLDAIITRNPTDFESSSVPIYSPSDWLTHSPISSPDEPRSR